MKRTRTQNDILCATDIGNSTITIGFFIRKKLLTHAIPTSPLLKPSAYRANIEGFLSQGRIEKRNFPCIISSVVPGHTRVFRKALALVTGAREEDVILVSSGMRTGLSFGVNLPERLGADRIAGAAAAWARYRVPLAVVDFGTATTITVVGKDALLIGGAILPGVGLMNEALSRGTSQLPRVPLEPPKQALGTDTVMCIQSGIFYGTAGAVERILHDIGKHARARLKVVVTGGHGPAMSACLGVRHTLHRDLTLEGLRILYGKNRPA